MKGYTAVAGGDPVDIPLQQQRSTSRWIALFTRGTQRPEDLTHQPFEDRAGHY